mmetsp:Transcript_28459/g.73594  ORF Transcript_28459/g.73594 Transcript_28459/m.73594 type:complete len:260 (-) Transcript_28459:2287-3066(-)
MAKPPEHLFRSRSTGLPTGSLGYKKTPKHPMPETTPTRPTPNQQLKTENKLENASNTCATTFRHKKNISCCWANALCKDHALRNGRRLARKLSTRLILHRRLIFAANSASLLKIAATIIESSPTSPTSKSGFALGRIDELRLKYFDRSHTDHKLIWLGARSDAGLAPADNVLVSSGIDSQEIVPSSSHRRWQRHTIDPKTWCWYCTFVNTWCSLEWHHETPIRIPNRDRCFIGRRDFDHSLVHVLQRSIGGMPPDDVLF